jgi:positive regulator of sigma E activity
MKTIAFILYMSTLCLMWLITNIFVAVIGDMSYAEAIRNDINVLFLLILYWWPGLFVLQDYDKWLATKGKYL